MKKIIAAVVAVVLCCTSVMAADVKVTLNNNIIKFGSQQPVILNGRTFVPLRGVFEELGYDVSWNSTTKTAEFNNSINKLIIFVGKDIFILNGEEKTMEEPAQNINGFVMLPINDIGSALGLKVSWDAAAKIVNIQYNTSSQSIISADEEYTLKTISSALSTEYMFITLNEKLDYIKRYYDSEIQKLLDESFSVTKTSAVFDNMIKSCEGFKQIALRADRGELDGDVIDSFIAYTGALKDFYKFQQEYICTDKYDSCNNIEIRQMLEKLENAKNDAGNHYYNAFNALSYGIMIIRQNDRYSEYFYDEEELSDEEKSVLNAYRADISKTVIQALSFCKDEKAVYDSKNYRNAAENIRNKLNTAQTPGLCLLDKEAMLRACDLLDKTAEDIEHGFNANNALEEYNIEFSSLFTVMGLMFSSTLSYEYFNTDMIFGGSTVIA